MRLTSSPFPVMRAPLQYLNLYIIESYRKKRLTMFDYSRFGWRARIGSVGPGDGLSTDEYWKFLPRGIAIYHAPTGVPNEPITVSMVRKCVETPEIERCVKVLLIRRPDVLIHPCTSCSFIGGIGWDKKIIERMEKASEGVPATTTSTAVVDALKTLKVKNVAVGSPYIDEINVIMKKFLKDSGFSVVSLGSLKLKYEWDIGNTPPYVVYRLAKTLDRPDADAIFIACTGVRMADVIDIMEKDFGKPVIGAIQATIWKALRIAGVRDSIKGRGLLLEKYLY